MSGASLTAAEVIARLGLTPHPEGGHFRETFRDARTDANGRALSTAIYFLLAEGEHSHWHRVDAAESWYYYAGDPLILSIVENGTRRDIMLGADLAAGELPQAVVPTGAWQAARPLGKWSLVGCVVAPGFTFDGFELATPDFNPLA